MIQDICLEVIALEKTQLTFVVFLLYALADEWNKKPAEIYSLLQSSNILDDYILPYYDVLHTQGKEYLVQDIIELAQERGILC